MKGFTLLETLVAITILVTVITGPLALAVYSISASLISQNQITAFYLSQEAVEFIKNVRDSNILHGNSWLNGLENCIGEINGCYIDIPHYYDSSTLFPPTNIIQPCSGTCPKIQYDEGGYYYNYQSGEETIFTRTVKITKINIGGGENEARIDVIIQWPEKFGGTKSFTLQQYIFNWK
jgi:prepilin-type N-terminal cleavage/methylation domain-containing protein